MKAKKIIVAIVIIAIVAVAAVLGFKKFGKHSESKSDEMVYVESVSNLTGMGLMNDRFMGVVESQETKDVNKDSEKKVKEIFVSVGQEVKEGDPLFEYDTEEMDLKLKQLQLELTSINNSISTTNQQINTLVKERDSAPAENKIEYTSQIQSLQAQVNQLNYDASSKQLEIDRQTAAMENTVVSAPMNGIIKEINEDSNNTSTGYEDYYGGDNQNKGFISIMALGDYRIKGTANEMNIWNFYEGQAVIIRSRLDESVVWHGIIDKVDTEHPVENNNNYYYDSSASQMTKYPFYISPDNIDGLLLGQHVYIEMDYGQGEVKEGLWLDDYYIIEDNGNYYVWAENSKGKIEKRKVEVGEYDENLWRYEIISGITEDDFIAFPEDRIKEGMTTTHNYEDVMDMDYGDMYDDGMYEEDGVYEDGMWEEDGAYEDGMWEEDGVYEEDGSYDVDEEMIPKEMDEEGVAE